MITLYDLSITRDMFLFATANHQSDTTSSDIADSQCNTKLNVSTFQYV